MVARYLIIIMLPILAALAAEATSERLEVGPISSLTRRSAANITDDCGVVCPTGDCCSYGTPNCCSGDYDYLDPILRDRLMRF